MDVEIAHARPGNITSSCVTSKHRLLIGSKWVESNAGKRFDVFGSATGHTIAAMAEAGAADIGAVVSPLNSGQPADYASDVWYPQPALPDHPWRRMRFHGRRIRPAPRRWRGARYAAGTRDIFECWFESRPIRPGYLIVDNGKLAVAEAHSDNVDRTRKINRERSVQS